MKRFISLLFSILLFAATLASCDQSGRTAVTIVPPEEITDTAPLEQEIAQLKEQNAQLRKQMDENDFHLTQLQETEARYKAADARYAQLYVKEAELFQATKGIAKGRLPIKNDFGDPVRREILDGFDFTTWSSNENDLVLYASVGKENEPLDTSKWVYLYVTTYHHDVPMEEGTPLRNLVATLVKVKGEWLVSAWSTVDDPITEDEQPAAPDKDNQPPFEPGVFVDFSKLLSDWVTDDMVQIMRDPFDAIVHKDIHTFIEGFHDWGVASNNFQLITTDEQYRFINVSYPNYIEEYNIIYFLVEFDVLHDHQIESRSASYSLKPDKHGIWKIEMID